jgi:hypothetical protein
MTHLKIKTLFSLLASITFGASAHAALLNFEDLDPAPASYDVMPSYNGFTFTNWLYGPDTVFTPASGTIDLFTDYADPNDPGAYVITNNNAITRTTDFYFDGAWFSGYSGVTFELWNDGNFLGAFGSLPDAAGPDPYGPTFLASGYAGLVDKVVVSGVQGYYSMDDFTFRLQDTGGTIPEPASIGLVLLALGLTTAQARKSSPKRGA